jgi:hypothetical protein
MNDWIFTLLLIAFGIMLEIAVNFISKKLSKKIFG